MLNKVLHRNQIRCRLLLKYTIFIYILRLDPNKFKLINSYVIVGHMQ